MASCEFGALILNPKFSMAAVCDLCPDDRVDGEPPCVRACPKDALSLATIDEVVEKTESETSKAILNEHEKAREGSKTFYERFGYMPMVPTRGLKNK
jgi:Fe-S-cluster-containing dehydrogenase component